MTKTKCTDPIFVLGISQRSGTNFLFDLLRLHPDCAVPLPIWEDFLLKNVGLLFEYVNLKCRGWRRRARPGDRLEESLSRHLGDGLISFLTSRITAPRLITKTPSVHNLDHFFKLFPRARLLILVRDGRAVAESSARTWGGKYEGRMRIWAEGAKTILRFEQTADKSACKYLIVRYEDLFTRTEPELRKIFAFVELDAEKYDFAAAAALPVKGSSTLRGQGKEKVHWQPVEKGSDFDPLQRWAHWSRSLHERFNWIAGEFLASFGYEEKKYETHRLFWTGWNMILDIKWRARSLLRLSSYSLKGVLKRIFGVERMAAVRRLVLPAASRSEIR